MAKNVGEYDEMRIKLRLIELRDSHQSLGLGSIKIIHSVKMEKEFHKLPISTNLKAMSDSAIESLANKVFAAKAPAGAKADVLINGIGFSIKSHRSAPPAIVNHTPRWGWYRVCEETGVDIRKLDQMVKDYYDLRRHHIIGEDVDNKNPHSPFASNKEYLRPILNYFLFEGTGRGVSKFPASYVLNCEDPYDLSMWTMYDKDKYLDKIWDNLVFSMRHKGFDSYPYSDIKKQELSKPWAKEFDGILKGSLHVRVK